MYPNYIRKRGLYPRHLGKAWLNGYTSIIEKRLGAKKLFKETGDVKYQAIQEAYKLSLNGGSFGKTNEQNSWQFDPFVTYGVTIGCQIDLLMLIEKYALAGIRVVSANTDGVTCLFPVEKEDVYKQACEEWEVLVGNNVLGQLEYVDYKTFVQLSVNDYLAIKTDGKPKFKGDFEYDKELHKNKSFRIIPLALYNYYAKGIPVRQTVEEHRAIYDFCGVVRADSSSGYMICKADGYEEQCTKLQKTNRYYISNSKDIFYKLNKDNKKEFVDAYPGNGVWHSTVFNRYEEKEFEDYNIDYSYYLWRINKIVKQIKPEIVIKKSEQKSLF